MRRCFLEAAAALGQQLEALRLATARTTAARHRLENAIARHDTRDWVVKRRERTRHLIELGGLVVKAGLVELADDDRALLYGAFLELADLLQGEEQKQRAILWRRRGSRAFRTEAEERNSV